VVPARTTLEQALSERRVRLWATADGNIVRVESGPALKHFYLDDADVSRAEACGSGACPERQRGARVNRPATSKARSHQHG
jgi:hypothetical protein